MHDLYGNDECGDLTDPQNTAVNHGDGPMLVLAGPGSGKTRVITRRIARLVSQGVPPWSILAVTFTNKAAGEMRQRVEEMVPGESGLTVTTFHSFCALLLRRYATDAGLESSYSIFDTSDQREAMKRALASEGLDTSNWTPASILSQVSNAKNTLRSPEEFAEDAADFVSRTVARAYTAYQKVLTKNNAVDFDDLLRLSAGLLRNNDAIRAQAQDRYRYVLIDEYQDTNHAQFVIANSIASTHGNIFAVGDPDQSIYAWRGADIGNILDFEAHYPGAQVVNLGRNFRSTGHIVQSASSLIRHNTSRRDKELTTELGEGEKIEIIGLDDEHHEARQIVEKIRSAGDDGMAWREMAVLYRVNALSRVLEEEFRRAGIPYVIARGTAFYDRKEIRDALAYLRMLCNPANEVALRRIINSPPRGIGDASLKRMQAHSAATGASLLEVCADPAACEGLGARAINSISRFSTMVAGWRSRVEHGESTELGELVSTVLRESGLERLDTLASEDDRQRQANLGELVTAATEYAPPSAVENEHGVCSLHIALQEYLESVALVSDADMVDPLQGAVTLMTLHAAKGLEFPFVAIIGIEDGVLPHMRSNESNDALEEERRLLFVGMTRAERRLILSAASVRTVRGMRQASMRSRFLSEISDDHCIRTDTDPLAGTFDQLADSGIEYDDPGAFDAEELADQFSPGTLVRHQQFGTGVVESFTPRRGVNSVTVRFKAIGRKTLVLEYARLTRLSSF